MDGGDRKAGRMAVAGPHQHPHQHQHEVFGRAAASPSAVLFGTTAECRAWLLFPRRSGNALRIEHPSHTFSPAELPEGTIGAPTSLALARSLSLAPCRLLHNHPPRVLPRASPCVVWSRPAPRVVVVIVFDDHRFAPTSRVTLDIGWATDRIAWVGRPSRDRRGTHGRTHRRRRCGETARRKQ